MTPSSPYAEVKTPTFGYGSGKALMTDGSLALHEHVASRLEMALGKPLPQMELRFKDVSISADITVNDESQTTVELPTIPNVIKSTVARMSAKKHVVK
ncbi:hypothetical protein BBJ28_00027183, partial [Nothophytophthora sp. Chile5]